MRSLGLKLRRDPLMARIVGVTSALGIVDGDNCQAFAMVRNLKSRGRSRFNPGNCYLTKVNHQEVGLAIDLMYIQPKFSSAAILCSAIGLYLTT